MRRGGDQTPPLILLAGHRLHTVRLCRGEEAQHTSAAAQVTTDKKYELLGQDQQALVCFEIHIEQISIRTPKQQAKQASQASKHSKAQQSKQTKQASNQI